MTTEIVSHSYSQDGSEDMHKVEDPKHAVMGSSEVVDVEEGETNKTFYSKTSVVFMVLFSGLALGSDG